MKNITFHEQINQILKNNAKGNPRLSTCLRKFDLAHA